MKETVAIIAGQIAASLLLRKGLDGRSYEHAPYGNSWLVKQSVEVARAIVVEVVGTELQK